MTAVSDEQISPQPLDTPSPPFISPPQNSSYLGQAFQVGQRPDAPSKFTQLPDSVIQSILWTVNPNTFASLCLLNRRWYKEAQVVELYAHHLSRCPSYALANTVITGPYRRNDLYRLKTKFAAEVRRNLFDAYIQPRRTLINLVSINANSSAAFPGGEVFRFEFSPNGRTILALSSSRVYVLNATADTIIVTRELKTSRKPISASITDDGTLLAVLSTKHQANVYGLPPNGNVQHLQVIVLDQSPRTIAMAHEGTVLAAAYETGVEVFSLANNALTTDRRAVRSEAVDTLTFTGDGSMIVGSSLSLDDPNAVVISAPFYTENDPDLSPREIHSRMWTTQILFPQISSVCSHVALLPGHNEGDATWLFAYDHSLLSYRAVRTDDTRAGVAYFLNPPSTRRFSVPSPTIAPTATSCGTLAVAGFGGVGLCLYGIPEKLDITPDMGAVVERHERRLQVSLPLTTATGNMEPLMAYSPSISGSSEQIEDDSLASKVDWRQSVFVKCKPLESIHGHVAARWVERPDHVERVFRGKRLLVVAPGGVGNTALGLEGEDMPVDGSRICLLDFDYAPTIGGNREITIEVGENDPELLVEYTGSLATEVAMERRRTIRALPSGEHPRMVLGRSITSIVSPSLPFPGVEHKRNNMSQPSSPMDGPSSPFPDTGVTEFQRSASAAGFRNALYPPRPPAGSHGPGGPNPALGVGRRSSADSWETPPPPYPSGIPRTHSQGSPPLHVQLSHVDISPPASDSLPDSLNTSSRLQAGVSLQQMYMPYRPLGPRRSIGMDGMPIGEGAHTRRAVSQYGVSARHRGQEPSLSSLDTVSESLSHRHGVRSVNLSSASTSAAPSHTMEPYYSRPRPLTHHGVTGTSSREFQSANYQPVLPITNAGLEQRRMNSDRNESAEAPRQISLTGANLQNRLNHPVPPVPNDDAMTNSRFDHNDQDPSEHHDLPDLAQHSAHLQSMQTEGDVHFPVMPTADQMARLNRRMSQPRVSGPSSPLKINTSPKPDNIRVPPSPPRGAWGAAGVPGSPSFHQARNVPNALTPNHSQSPSRSGPNNMASSSTPSLITRPPYGRLDTIESIGDITEFPLPRTLSRAQSVSYPSGRESTAYDETRRAAPGISLGRGKREKKRKNDRGGDGGGGKKSTRCVVM